MTMNKSFLWIRNSPRNDGRATWGLERITKSVPKVVNCGDRNLFIGHKWDTTATVSVNPPGSVADDNMGFTYWSVVRPWDPFGKQTLWLKDKQTVGTNPSVLFLLLWAKGCWRVVAFDFPGAEQVARLLSARRILKLAHVLQFTKRLDSTFASSIGCWVWRVPPVGYL